MDGKYNYQDMMVENGNVRHHLISSQINEFGT